MMRAQTLSALARVLRAVGPTDDMSFHFTCAAVGNIAEVAPAARTALLLSGTAEAVVHCLKQRRATGTLDADAAYHGCFALAKIAADAASAEPLVVMRVAPLILQILHQHAADEKAAGAACTVLAHPTALEPSDGSPCRVTAEELLKGDVAGALAAVVAEHASQPSVVLPVCTATDILRGCLLPSVRAALAAHADVLASVEASQAEFEEQLDARPLHRHLLRAAMRTMTRTSWQSFCRRASSVARRQPRCWQRPPRCHRRIRPEAQAQAGVKLE